MQYTKSILMTLMILLSGFSAKAGLKSLVENAGTQTAPIIKIAPEWFVQDVCGKNGLSIHECAEAWRMKFSELKNSQELNDAELIEAEEFNPEAAIETL